MVSDICIPIRKPGTKFTPEIPARRQQLADILPKSGRFPCAFPETRRGGGTMSVLASKRFTEGRVSPHECSHVDEAVTWLPRTIVQARKSRRTSF